MLIKSYWKNILVFIITGFVLTILYLQHPCKETKNSENENIKFGSEQIKSLLKDGRPEYTIDEANAIISDLIPIIEVIAARKFKKIPKISLINTDKVDDLIIKEKNCEGKNKSTEY